MTNSNSRCEEHVGEVFPPRCSECDTTAASSRPRLGFIPGTECDQHPGYPMPCARCERDAAERSEALSGAVRPVKGR